MNKSLIILFVLLITEGCNVALKSQQSSFDKEKWLTSSGYRYEICKSTNFPDFRGKSKRYVKKLLGEPDEVNGDTFIYCMDINPDKKSKEKNCHCKASSVTINFKDERWTTTFIWAEPLN